MITHWDADEICRETAAEAGTEGEDVHLQHFADGHPLCWDQGRTGAFSGSFDDKDITCKACIDYAGIPG